MFNQQKARWMMLGWLGRSRHLVSMAAGLSYLSKDKKSVQFFSLRQREKLSKAAGLIHEVLEEIRGNTR